MKTQLYTRTSAIYTTNSNLQTQKKTNSPTFTGNKISTEKIKNNGLQKVLANARKKIKITKKTLKLLGLYVLIGGGSLGIKLFKKDVLHIPVVKTVRINKGEIGRVIAGKDTFNIVIDEAGKLIQKK